MIPRVEIARVAVAGGWLRLVRRGDEFSILLDSVELMNSRRGGSEESLALLACDRLMGKSDVHLLIGGLGLGFTLRAALGRLGDRARVTVAELVPEVISWARGPLVPLFGACLDDPRVLLETGDVADTIGRSRAAFDAILLDVDNGPQGLTAGANDRLYSAAGLADARRALRPGGLLAIWSAAPDAAFVRTLGRSGFAVEEVAAGSSRRGRGPRHVVWLATPRGG